MIVEDEIMHILVAEVMKKSLTIAPTHCEVFVTELVGRDANHDSNIPAIFYVEYACTSATPQKASGTAMKIDEKNMAFVKFSEKHRTLLNAFIR
ncbi:hypothetical protein VNO78_22115 [Psophocarpus tetragonolobus]|uniref:Uncharacterized protein n=1 Tax=Psophocarpus tetragonolobus TaxID=3891 RepID=A0AAN9SCS8_PSOTE